MPAKFADIHVQLSEQSHLTGVDGAKAGILKSSTLRTIVRLRSSAILSPLARLVPTHFQRRVKSWLGK